MVVQRQGQCPPGNAQGLRDNGLRLLLVGYESGNQQILINIKKGLRVDRARQFAADCRDLGITVHGTFILGLPGETRETIEETIRFAREVNPHTIQVSIAAPYPGTELHRQAVEKGWLPGDDAGATLVSERGTQLAALSYPHLGHTEILESVDAFYRRFYFRAGKLAEMSAELFRSPGMATRRLREGREFVRFLNRRPREARSDARPARPSQRADVLGDLPAARAARIGTRGRGPAGRRP
jgi:radical SAM superfamily enzyme YgiQ (UPF0313 family)